MTGLVADLKDKRLPLYHSLMEWARFPLTVDWAINVYVTDPKLTGLSSIVNGEPVVDRLESGLAASDEYEYIFNFESFSCK